MAKHHHNVVGSIRALAALVLALVSETAAIAAWVAPNAWRRTEDQVLAGLSPQRRRFVLGSLGGIVLLAAIAIQALQKEPNHHPGIAILLVPTWRQGISGANKGFDRNGGAPRRGGNDVALDLLPVHFAGNQSVPRLPDPSDGDVKSRAAELPSRLVSLPREWQARVYP